MLKDAFWVTTALSPLLSEFHIPLSKGLCSLRGMSLTWPNGKYQGKRCGRLGWVANQSQPSKESCQEFLVLGVKARCTFVQVMRLQWCLPTVTWYCNIIAVPSGAGSITLLKSVEIVNNYDTMLQMIVFSQVCVVGWVLLFPCWFFFNQVPVAVVWSFLVGSLIRSLNWDAILQMDRTGVCSFFTNPVMELSCCIKGGQRLFTGFQKTFLLWTLL